MNDNVKIEDAVEVSLPTTNDPTCSVSHSNKVKDECFLADLNTDVKHEDSSIQTLNHRIHFEAPDVKYVITSDSNDNDIKLEPLEHEELELEELTLPKEQQKSVLNLNIPYEQICQCILKHTR